jgi:acyl carrier protein
MPDDRPGHERGLPSYSATRKEDPTTAMQHLKAIPAGANEPGARGLDPEELELARLIVATLNIEDVKPEDIDPEAPLYGEGLGLDSIDILEMSLAVSKAYGVQLRSDDPDNDRIFRSLRSLNAHIRSRRAK